MKSNLFKILTIDTFLQNKMNTQDTVIFESGEIIVTDPCYDFSDCGSQTYQKIIKLEPGKYKIRVSTSQDNRISELEILKADIDSCASTLWEELLSDKIGVDSGQCGFFDTKYYKENGYYTNLDRVSSTIICENDPFYSICCDRTLSDKQWGTIPYGVVSSSGYGDGQYSLYGLYSKTNNDTKTLHGAVLIFIDGEEEEEEEDI